jgi:hypothetical protein
MTAKKSGTHQTPVRSPKSRATSSRSGAHPSGRARPRADHTSRATPMIAADTSTSSTLSLSTQLVAEESVIAAPAKSPRRASRTKKASEVHISTIPSHDVTPPTLRTYVQEYHLSDERFGIEIEASSALETCKGCAWCTERERVGCEETPHHWLDRDLLILSISLEGVEHPGHFSGFMKAQQLHRIIENLGAIRDRMVTDGVLAPREGAAVDAGLASILNRPSEYSVGEIAGACACSVCAAMRAAAFSCLACGFGGTPIVPACTCPESPVYETDVRHVAEDEDCNTGHARWRTCPVCEVGQMNRDSSAAFVREAFPDKDGSVHAAGIIRDLRSALRSRGLV